MRSVARPPEHRLAQWVSELAPRCPRDRDLAVCPGLPEVDSPALVLPVTTTSDFVVPRCDGCGVRACTMDGCIHVKFRPTSGVSTPSSSKCRPIRGQPGFAHSRRKLAEKGPQVTTLRAVFQRGSMRCSRPTPSTRFIRSGPLTQVSWAKRPPNFGRLGVRGGLGACGTGFFSRQASGTRVAISASGGAAVAIQSVLRLYRVLKVIS
jgi:hypothetical protein